MITKNPLRTMRIVTNFLIICFIAIGLIFLWPLFKYRQNDRYKCQGDILECTASVFGEDDQCHSNACWISFNDKFIMKSKMTFNMYDKFVENVKEKCSNKEWLNNDENLENKCKEYEDINLWLSDISIPDDKNQYVKGLSTEKINMICRDILFFDGFYENNGRLITIEEVKQLKSVKHKNLNINKPCSTIYRNGMCDLDEFEILDGWIIDYENSTFRCVADGSEIRSYI